MISCSWLVLTLEVEDSEFLCLRRLNCRRGFWPWLSAASPLVCWPSGASGCLTSPWLWVSAGAAACWPSGDSPGGGRGRKGLWHDRDRHEVYSSSPVLEWKLFKNKNKQKNNTYRPKSKPRTGESSVMCGQFKKWCQGHLRYGGRNLRCGGLCWPFSTTSLFCSPVSPWKTRLVNKRALMYTISLDLFEFSFI